jgi:hypothetical protein
MHNPSAHPSIGDGVVRFFQDDENHTATQMLALIPGTRLGQYEVVEALGVGGMGEVYRARDLKLGRSVAIKVLLPAVASDPDRLARFEREAKTLASDEPSEHRAVVVDVDKRTDIWGLDVPQRFRRPPTAAIVRRVLS